MVALRTGQPQRGVLMGVHTPDGRLTWLLINAQPIVDATDYGAAPVAVVASFIDMTDQKRILDTQQTLVSVLEASHDAIGTATLDGTMQYLNPAGRRLRGLPEDAPLAGLTLWELLAADEPQKAADQVRQHGTWAGEAAYRGLADTVPTCVAADIFTIPATTAGPPVALAIVSHDLTQQKAAPLLYQDTCLGTLTVGNGVEQVVWSAHDAELVQSIALHMASAVAHARLHEAIKESAITDPLTGVANRRGWFMVAQSHWEQAQRQPPLAVALLDADHFKRVNDTYGHAVGDQVLQILALRCREMVRAMDLVSRYGGEEFVILLPTADAPTAAMVAERIRLAVSSTPFPTTAGPLPITVSLGVAVAHDTHEPLAQLLEQADAALYAAKRHGRNQVRVWTATPPAP